jgi:hypothetical protein
MKLKILVISLSLCLLAGCSSDPFDNAGKCETPGESKSIDERVAVCTGNEGKLKWYFEGKYFEDVLLLAKLEYLTFSVGDTFFKKLDAEDLSKSFFKINSTSELQVIDLANYASGDSRWDALIEAQAKYEKEKELEDYYFQERIRLIVEKSKGKATESEFLAAARASSLQQDVTYKFKESRDVKAQVLKATLISKYNITDKDALLIFLSRYVKQQNL